MSLRDELQAIYDQHGKLTKRLVVDLARDMEGSELHQRLYLDLDDDQAADTGRLYLAGCLIRRIKVVYRNPDKPNAPERAVRAWHAIPSVPADDDGDVDGFKNFEPVEEIARDPFKLQLVLRDMEREWKMFRARYGHLKEFAELILRDLGDAA